MKRFSNKVMLITGGAGDIGGAVANRLTGANIPISVGIL